MKIRFATLCQLMALTLIACFCLSALALARDAPTSDESVRPRFMVIPKPIDLNLPAPPTTLQEWNGSFVYNGIWPYVMVGADPSTNTSATIPTSIIPVKIILSTGQSFDPLVPTPFSPYVRTVTSPIFDMTTTYDLPPIVGKTQYIDAFQRANFWSIVSVNTSSHLLLTTPPIAVNPALPELVLSVPAADGHLGHPFGHAAALVDINYFDAQVSAYMTAHSQIDPSKFAIFETTDTYLTEGGSCCIGGYHSNNGAQTYAHFTYIDHPGDFAQDVSALSHEVGEWADDPLYPSPNNTPCGILEVGDPLEGTTNYGDYPYVLHGFTYHLQDLVFLRYFGAPANTSVNDWWSFQNYPFTTICQNGS